MANAIRALFDAVQTLTITLTSLANGAGRVSAQYDNTVAKATRGFLAVRTKMGASAPSGAQAVRFYLIRNSNAGTNIQGGRLGTALGTADAAATVEPVNAELIGTVYISAAAQNVDELFLIVDPGPLFSIVAWCAAGNALDSTAGNHVLQWVPFVDEVQ